MRKLLLTMTAAAAILSAPALAPAHAMTVGTATAIEAALAEIGARAGRGLCLPAPLPHQPPGLLVAARAIRGWRWHWRRWR